MSNFIRMAAQIHALENGRAVPVAGVKRTVILDDAHIVVPLAMSGEDATLHAVAIGRPWQEPELFIIPDPRNRDDQYALLEALETIFTPMFQVAQQSGRFPQIIVASAPAVDHIDILATRLRASDDSPAVTRLGNWLTWFADRAPIPGQLAVISATALLREHFAVGQDDMENEHLGAVLAWHEGDPATVFDRILTEERKPFGVKTPPEFDRDTLAPLVSAHNRARRANQADRMQEYNDAIADALEPLLRDIYHGIERALGVMANWQAQTGAWLPNLMALESKAFELFMRRVNDITQHNLANPGTPKKAFYDRDFPNIAASKLVLRESMLQAMEKALVHHDPVAREAARLEGRAVFGTVIVRSRNKPPGARKARAVLSVRSDTDTLKIRIGDEVCLIGHGTMLDVEDIARDPTGVVLHLRSKSGHDPALALVVGDDVWLGPEQLNWNFIQNQQVNMATTLNHLSWTHDKTVPVPQPPNQPNRRTLGATLLQQIEALQ